MNKLHLYKMDKKQKLYDKNKKIVDQVVDGLMRPLDEKIKDLCIILNTMGFETDASCEGHIDVKNNISFAPWVDISFETREMHDKYWQERSKEFKIIDKKKKAGAKINFKLYEKLHKIENKHEAYITKKGRILEKYLLDFYKKRKVNYDSIITFNRFDKGFRIEPIGGVLQIGRSLNERKICLKNYQKEFRDFEKFLKNRYFK